jgi:hypothetical protein
MKCAKTAIEKQKRNAVLQVLVNCAGIGGALRIVGKEGQCRWRILKDNQSKSCWQF